MSTITKQYQFAVNNEGLLFVRLRSCWCLPCMAALLEGTLHWPEQKEIAGCETVALGGQDLMYKFTKAAALKVRGPMRLDRLLLLTSEHVLRGRSRSQ